METKSKTEIGHTPTPEIELFELSQALKRIGYSTEESRFIVCAVRSHDALLLSLKRALPILKEMEVFGTRLNVDLTDKIESAIARAEARP